MDISKFFKELIKNIQLMAFRKERADFYRNLADSFDQKEKFVSYLQEEYKIAKAKHTKSDSKAYAFKMMIKRVSRGEDANLSQVLRDVAPKSDHMMLNALDSTKDKSATLRALADGVEEQGKATALIKKNLIAPLVILPGVGVFIYVLATQSIPIIVEIAPASVWTPFNQAVRSFAEFFATKWHYVLLAIGFLIAGGYYMLPNWSGATRTRIENLKKGYLLLLMPIFPYGLVMSLYKEYQVTQMMSSMAVMVRSGQTLMGCLNDIKRVATPHMKFHVSRIIRHLENNPTEYVQAFSRGFLSPVVLGKMATIVRTKDKFDDVLVELGTKGTIQARIEIEKTAKNMNTFVLILAASIVIFLYVGQLSISDTMQNELDPSKLLRNR